MTFSPSLKTASDPSLNRENLPTMYDLPSDNPEDSGLPDEFHFFQPLLLYLTFQPLNWPPEMVFSAVDLNLYYDLKHPLWYKRPDWFGVVGISKLYNGKDGENLRLSYVTWQELVNPFVIVELLSPGTEDEDLGNKEGKPNKPPTKWDVYESILQIPYYIIYSRYTYQMQAFQLVNGKYQEMNLTQGKILIPELGLSLGLWEGTFRGIYKQWLRWFTITGELILEPSEKTAVFEEMVEIAEEQAAVFEERAEIAEQEANEAKRKAAILAEKLRQLGVNPDELL